MRVVIAGSRDATRAEDVSEAMATAALFDIKPSTVFSGGARGVDRLGEQWARWHNIPVNIFLPVWRDANGAFRPTAGFERNEAMLKAADAAVFVWDGKSPGTKHAINFANILCLPHWIHRVKPISHSVKSRRDPYED